MISEDLLIRFLVTLCVIFFIPKVIYHVVKIPASLSEIILGILLGIFLPAFFYVDDMFRILATLGIITLFVHAGLEVEPDFIVAKRKFFFENSIRHIIVLLITGTALRYILDLSYQISFIVALALITPSASFILSSLNPHNYNKRWIESQAISGELVSLLALVFLLKINSLKSMAITVLALVLLVTILPWMLEKLYLKIFKKLIGTEFSFIFVVALISAFITELLGIHFLVGAFIAGVVTKEFISDLMYTYSDISIDRGTQLVEGFGFFAKTFVPFYFFTIGLGLKADIFVWSNLRIVLMIFLLASILRVASIAFHRKLRLNEDMIKSLRIGTALLPTLVFTFVIADLLLSEFSISVQLYNLLILYGLATAILTFFFSSVLKEKSLFSFYKL